MMQGIRYSVPPAATIGYPTNWQPQYTILPQQMTQMMPGVEGPAAYSISQLAAQMSQLGLSSAVSGSFKTKMTTELDHWPLWPLSVRPFFSVQSRPLLAVRLQRGHVQPGPGPAAAAGRRRRRRRAAVGHGLHTHVAEYVGPAQQQPGSAQYDCRLQLLLTKQMTISLTTWPASRFVVRLADRLSRRRLALRTYYELLEKEWKWMKWRRKRIENGSNDQCSWA